MDSKRVLTNEHKELLRDLYYNQGYMMGRDKLYELVKERFPTSHPSRRAIQHEFLERQEVYQLHVRPVSKLKATKPVRVTKVMRYFQCDLHSVQNIKEKGINSLFGLVEVLIGMFYCKPMRGKTAEEMAKVFADILRENPDIDISVCQNDRGTEFFGAFAQQLKDLNIKQIYSNAQSPMTNGFIERRWSDLSSLMFKSMHARKSFSWLPYLQKFVDATNSTKNRMTGFTPKQAAANADLVARRRLATESWLRMSPRIT